MLIRWKRSKQWVVGFGFAASLLAFGLVGEKAAACTRVVYLGEDSQILTARSMDWRDDIETNVWIMPRDVSRSGETGQNTIQWTSKYGSVVSSGYDISTTDGLNEKGLAVNALWLAESEYPEFDENGSVPGLSISVWGQYVLDNFATVAEAVSALEKNEFVVVTSKVPGQQRLATLHLAMSDASGDSAIIEYIDGKQVIHHSRQYQVLTNSPPYAQQLALNAYWEQVGGRSMLPGTGRAADRFVRASFYTQAIPQNAPLDEAIAGILGVIRNASVPYGITSDDEPNLSSTRWRTLVDHKNLVYYFESALSPNAFWVDLQNVDFGFDPTQAKRLELGPQQRKTYHGDTSAQFELTEPFEFLGV